MTLRFSFEYILKNATNSNSLKKKFSSIYVITQHRKSNMTNIQNVNKYAVPISTGAALGSLMYATSAGNNRNMFSRYAPLSYPVIGALAGYRYANMMTPAIPNTINAAPESIHNTELERRVKWNSDAINLLLRYQLLWYNIGHQGALGIPHTQEQTEENGQLVNAMNAMLENFPS